MTNQYFLQHCGEARTRFSNLLAGLSESDLKKKLGGSPNPAGFLIWHVAGVELLFAKNIFRQNDVMVYPKTVAAQQDTGEWTDLQVLLVYQQYAFDCLRKAIEAQPGESWDEEVITKEFGAKTKAGALGRIVSHTACHARQLGIILKYGTHA